MGWTFTGSRFFAARRALPLLDKIGLTVVSSRPEHFSTASVAQLKSGRGTLMPGVDLDARLKLSARKLRAWNWMATISTRQVEAVDILREEARILIEIGLQHPEQVRRIGRLIVAYRKLIDAIELRIEQRHLVNV